MRSAICQPDPPGGAPRLRRRSGIPDFTPHDLRRTAATLMGERGVRPDVIERVLNHTPTKIARTYNRAAYDAEKRQALAMAIASPFAIIQGRRLWPDRPASCVRHGARSALSRDAATK